MTTPPVEGYIDTVLVIALKIAREQPFVGEDRFYLYNTIQEYFNPLKTIQVSYIDPRKPVHEIEYRIEYDQDFPFAVCVDQVDNQTICETLLENPNLIESWEQRIVSQLAAVPHYELSFKGIKIEEVLSMSVSYIDLASLG